MHLRDIEEETIEEYDTCLEQRGQIRKHIEAGEIGKAKELLKTHFGMQYQGNAKLKCSIYSIEFLDLVK